MVITRVARYASQVKISINRVDASDSDDHFLSVYHRNHPNLLKIYPYDASLARHLIVAHILSCVNVVLSLQEIKGIASTHLNRRNKIKK